MFSELSILFRCLSVDQKVCGNIISVRDELIPLENSALVCEFFSLLKKYLQFLYCTKSMVLLKCKKNVFPLGEAREVLVSGVKLQVQA